MKFSVLANTIGPIVAISNRFPAINATKSKIRNNFCCSGVWPDEEAAGGGALNKKNWVIYVLCNYYLERISICLIASLNSWVSLLISSPWLPLCPVAPLEGFPSFIETVFFALAGSGRSFSMLWLFSVYFFFAIQVYSSIIKIKTNIWKILLPIPVNIKWFFFDCDFWRSLSNNRNACFIWWWWWVL